MRKSLRRGDPRPKADRSPWWVAFPDPAVISARGARPGHRRIRPVPGPTAAGSSSASRCAPPRRRPASSKGGSRQNRAIRVFCQEQSASACPELVAVAFSTWGRGFRKTKWGVAYTSKGRDWAACAGRKTGRGGVGAAGSLGPALTEAGAVWGATSIPALTCRPTLRPRRTRSTRAGSCLSGQRYLSVLIRSGSGS